MKKLILLLPCLSLLLLSQVEAQTNQTTLDQIIKLVGSPTNYAIEPYLTYAPSAKTKVGGGALMADNFNQYVGLGLGVDWLGQFSLVSGNVTLSLPFHPLPTLFPTVQMTPFVLGGIATAYSGAGKFNGQASTVSDIGDYIKFGHLLGGQFNLGACYGKWSNVGPDYGGNRYHIFFGWSKGF